MRLTGSCALLATLALMVTACSLPTRPVPPATSGDRNFAPVPAPGVPLTLVPMRMGHRQVPRCFAAGDAPCWKMMDLVYAAYLVRHPSGTTFLIDAGYSRRAKDDLAVFPALQRAALSYTPEGSLGGYLQKLGEPRIDFVLLTHIHFDHTSGLTDLDRPEVWLDEAEYAFLKSARRPQEFGVLPAHFDRAVISVFPFAGPRVENWPASRDIFGDGSVVLVPMPGHTPGGMGIFLNSVNGRRLFFIGDTAWSMDSVRLPSHKPMATSDKSDFDAEVLGPSLRKVNEIARAFPELVIVPAHDGEVFQEVKELAGRRPPR